MSHRKKIVLLKNDLSQGGGLEKYTLRLAGAFAERGCEVTVLTSGNPPQLPLNASFRVISLMARPWLSAVHVMRFDKLCQKWLKDYAADIVFGMDRNSFQTHYRAGNGVHAAYLEHRCRLEPWWKQLSFRYNPLHRSILELEKQTFENEALRLLFVNSAMVREELLSHYHVDPHKIQVVHNGVEWQEMTSLFSSWEQERTRLLGERELDGSAYQFLFVGHGFRRKGLQQLLEALALLHQRSHPFQLSILGKDKELCFFKTEVAKKGLSHRVKFFGQRNDVRSFYQLADALIIPSLYDPFANVTVEALAMGVHVVSSKTNGGHEVLTNHSGTIIDNVFASDSFANTLENAMRHPKSTKRALETRNSVQHLDFSHQLDRIVSATLTR